MGRSKRYRYTPLQTSFPVSQRTQIGTASEHIRFVFLFFFYFLFLILGSSRLIKIAYTPAFERTQMQFIIYRVGH